MYVLCILISNGLNKKWEGQAYMQIFLRFAPMIIYVGSYINIQYMQFVDAYDGEETLPACWAEYESNEEWVEFISHYELLEIWIFYA